MTTRFIVCFLSLLLGGAVVARAQDSGLHGTWVNEFQEEGKSYTMYMRFEAPDQYRSWMEGAETDPGSSGVFTAGEGALSIKKTDGAQMESEYALQGADVLVLKSQRGSTTWKRVAGGRRAPGEAEPGPGATPLSDGDAAASFEKGALQYRAKNMAPAFAWFLKAAELGHVKARLQVGWHYARGVGVGRDPVEAVKWYRLAAEGGDATAMKNLGQHLEDGLGVEENWVEAAVWYRKGANLADSDAEAALSRAYQFGVGVPQDRTLAIQWSKRAAEHGDAESARWVSWLKDRTNNIGFRNQNEHDIVIGGRLVSSGVLFGADPAGKLFRNSAERIAWLVTLRDAVDRDIEESRRRQAELDRQREEEERRRKQGY